MFAFCSRVTGTVAIFAVVLSAMVLSMAGLAVHMVGAESSVASVTTDRPDGLATGLLALAVLALAVLGGLGWMVSRTVGVPTRRLADSMGRLADGDLEVPAPALDGRGDLGRLASAIDLLRKRSMEGRELARTQDDDTRLTERQRSRTLLALLHDLVDVAVDGNEAMISMVRMQRGVSGTEEQVQSIASALEEMRAAINDISENSERAICEARSSEDAAA